MKSITIVLSVIMFCLIVRFFVENSLPHFRGMLTESLARLCSRITEVLGILLTGERFYTVWVYLVEGSELEEVVTTSEIKEQVHSIITCAVLGASGPEEMKRVMELASAEAARMSVREYAKICGEYCIVIPRLIQEKESKIRPNKENGTEKNGDES